MTYRVTHPVVLFRANLLRGGDLWINLRPLAACGRARFASKCGPWRLFPFIATWG